MAAQLRCIAVDLDGSVADQPGLRARLTSGRAMLIPARDLAPALRIVASRTALADLTGRMAHIAPAGQGGAPLIFYGSGDFHHLAALFIAAAKGPLTILHIDNHPDWTGFPATWNCGGWVNRALDLPGVERVVTIGPASDDFVRPQLAFANLDAIRSGRLEVHPWRAAPSRLWGRPVNGPGCRTTAGHIHWNCLAGREWEAFAAALDARLPPTPIWVSLDKDALGPEEAVTNWDQGGLGLDAVLSLIRRLARRRPLRGMDVCGDYSVPLYRDPFRWFLSATDHPRLPPVDRAAACSINDLTNTRILHAADAMAAEGLWPT